MSKLESLWVRLHVEGRIRACDAFLLRRLNVPPFNATPILQVNAAGYVVTVGAPGAAVPVRSHDVLRAFEARYGIPESCDKMFTGEHPKRAAGGPHARSGVEAVMTARSNAGKE